MISTALNFTLKQNSKILAAPGCVSQIAEVLADAGYSHPMLIFDQGVKSCGIVDRVEKVLSDAGIPYSEFGDVLPDPPCTTVAAATDRCKAEGCDSLISIGGGSAIDTAKGVSVERFNPGKRILDFADPSVPMNLSPGHIAIPTTAGTGAELSNGIIITDPERQVKVPIVGDKAMAEYVLLDAELTVGMPAGLTMMTGLDVFSHAMEAYTTVLAGPVTDVICEKLMEDVVYWLPICVSEPKNIEARQRMLICASMGGWMLAHCCAQVGHSLAHVIGAKFHVPHGAAVAYYAPACIEITAQAKPEKMRRVGEILGVMFDGSESPDDIGEETRQAYIEFRDSLGLKPISSYGVTKEGAEALAKDVVNEPFAPLCPVKIDEDTARRLLGSIF